jgi:hypothetical protein
MIEQVLLTDGFYYSSSYDLTHTLQRLSKTSPDFLQMPLHERVMLRHVTVKQWIFDPLITHNAYA